MYIEPKQLERMNAYCRPNKVMAIYGPRRCGKTTLVDKFVERAAGKFGLVKKVSGDELPTRAAMSSQRLETLRSFVGQTKLLVVDEAQRIPEIGLNLKLIVDHLPGVAVIATGSSSFDLASKIRESLTGRAYSLRLFPLAQMEIGATEHHLDTEAHLATRLVYGSYPEVVTTDGDDERREYLNELVGSYLFKDLLEMGGIKHADRLERLLQLVGLQLGREVSLTELGRQLEMDSKTVAHYLDLLEKCFVLYRVGGFSRNLRKEISKSSRYYFWDVGIRNALIGDFRPLALRDDAGELWENYLVMERVKRREYVGPHAKAFFWRTHTRQEIDLVEMYDGGLHGYEIKWGDRQPKAPAEWRRTYPEATFEVVNRANYLEFIC